MRKLLTLILLVLLVPATASANSLVHWHVHWHRNWYVRTHHVHHHARHAESVSAPTRIQVPAPVIQTPINTGLQYTAATDEGDCQNNFNPIPFLQAHQANVLRFGVQPSFLPTQAGLGCINDARAAGYKIDLVLAYNSSDSPTSVASYVTQAIQTYGPTWAISFGNEEDIANPWVPNPVGEDAQDYVAMWTAVEPTIAADDPDAIRVVGNSDPWSVGWTERVMAAHPVGAQAVAFHCYVEPQGGILAVPEMAQEAATTGLPLWCDEMAPGINNAQAPWLVQQTLAQYTAQTQQVFAQTPNVQMNSWFEWDAIGATTPGI